MPRTRPTTETPLAMPSVARALRIAGRVLRGRCPHCGAGKVLERWINHPSRWGKVKARCSACGLRFDRGDENYFGNAITFNLLMMEMLFAAIFLGTLFLTWPNVPWEALTWVSAGTIALSAILFYPLSKVVWLGVDVLLRPVTSDELRPGWEVPSRRITYVPPDEPRP